MFGLLIMTLKAVILLTAGIYAFAALLNKEDAAWIKGAPFKIMVGLYVVGLWGHIIWVVFLALMLSIPLLARNRGDAAALYAIAVLSLPDLPYKFQIGGFYVAEIDKYMFAAFGLAIAFRRFAGEVRSGSRFDIPFLIVLTLELAESRDPQWTTELRMMLPTLLTLALPYYLVSRSITSMQDIRRFVLALTLGGFVLAIVATAEVRFHTLFYQQITSNLPVALGENLYQKMRGGVIRAPASFPESTSLANFLAASAIAVLGLGTAFASKIKRNIALGVLLIGLVAANSRGAFIGVALGLLAFDFYRKRWGALSVKLGIGSGIYVAALIAAPFSPYVAGMVGKGSDTQGSTNYRVQLLTRGMEEIRKHPLLGTTMKNALDSLEDMRTGQHIIDLVNGYITYGLTLGYTGMVGLLMVFVTLSGAMLVTRRKLRGNDLALDAAAFVFSVSSFMAAVAFFTTFGSEKSSFFYWIAALGAALYALRRGAPALALPGAEPVAAHPSGIQSMIQADRAAAAARARRLRGDNVA